MAAAAECLPLLSLPLGLGFGLGLASGFNRAAILEPNRVGKRGHFWHCSKNALVQMDTIMELGGWRCRWDGRGAHMGRKGGGVRAGQQVQSMDG